MFQDYITISVLGRRVVLCRKVVWQPELPRCPCTWLGRGYRNNGSSGHPGVSCRQAGAPRNYWDPWCITHRPTDHVSCLAVLALTMSSHDNNADEDAAHSHDDDDVNDDDANNYHNSKSY